MGLTIALGEAESTGKNQLLSWENSTELSDKTEVYWVEDKGLITWLNLAEYWIWKINFGVYLQKCMARFTNSVPLKMIIKFNGTQKL